MEKYWFAKSSKNPPVGNNVVNYGHKFYSYIFELMLPIKANYLWPAMWSNVFNEDDVLNSSLADEYWIVMGTYIKCQWFGRSKSGIVAILERLGTGIIRAILILWSISWESVSDSIETMKVLLTWGCVEPMIQKWVVTSNIEMVEHIVEKQQEIIREEMNPIISKVPQS